VLQRLSDYSVLQPTETAERLTVATSL